MLHLLTVACRVSRPVLSFMNEVSQRTVNPFSLILREAPQTGRYGTANEQCFLGIREAHVQEKTHRLSGWEGGLPPSPGNTLGISAPRRLRMEDHHKFKIGQVLGQPRLHSKIKIN